MFDFDWLRMPFSVGYGQFVIGESEIRGPLVGATMRGKADFRARQVNVGGTYVPLQGLNSALGAIPGLGQILGPRQITPNVDDRSELETELRQNTSQVFESLAALASKVALCDQVAIIV